MAGSRSYEELARTMIGTRGPFVGTRKGATATAKRDRLPVLEEWAKKPRTMGQTVKFLTALEETCKEQERTCDNLADNGLLKKVHDQAQKISALHNMLKDVAAYIEHEAINGHKG